ncbi:costars family protein ABRACL isoform X1 [Rhea pennata]|uniref:costars family protein ABRACL isoform X1 n=1 Tax=Rhea pennata TaxID=8795 RepID=UPI002E25FF2F
MFNSRGRRYPPARKPLSAENRARRGLAAARPLSPSAAAGSFRLASASPLPPSLPPSLPPALRGSRRRQRTTMNVEHEIDLLVEEIRRLGTKICMCFHVLSLI